MPKQQATNEGSKAPSFLQDLAGKTGADIPDHDPLLPVGTWEFDFIKYAVEDKDGDYGAYTMVTVHLDPVGPVDVEEPGESWEDMRQYVRLFLARPKDARNIKRLAAAFGVDVETVPVLHYDEDGKVVFDMLEAAKGERGEGEVKKAVNKKTNEEDRRFYF